MVTESQHSGGGGTTQRIQAQPVSHSRTLSQKEKGNGACLVECYK
jgi:hypothetical protein